MFAQERRREILSLLRKHRRLDVRALTEKLGVSAATLRRDLSHLDRTDKVLRVHGGVMLPGMTPDEASLRQKAATAIKAKRIIAQSAADTIPAGSTVFIDSGTTCLEAGLLLRQRADLTIITNSLPLIAGYDRFNAKLIVLGGERRVVSGALVGGLAIDALCQLRADIALIGASGLHPADGAGTTELLETGIKREWIRRAKRACLLVDATKWRQITAIRFADWNEFTEFFTDKEPPSDFKKKSLKVVIA
jgi:DeoR/GlpR family transcriptional regulator of sugar metabolism